MDWTKQGDMARYNVVHITGDGGNDVSMIQAADVGIGIIGKVRSALWHPLRKRFVTESYGKMKKSYAMVCHSGTLRRCSSYPSCGRLGYWTSTYLRRGLYSV